MTAYFTIFGILLFRNIVTPHLREKQDEQMVLLLERTHESPRVAMKIPGSLAPAPELLNQEVWHQVQETTVLILCWGFWCRLPNQEPQFEKC